MRIAQVVNGEESVPPLFQNGLEFIVSWLTEELVKRGHDVTLFASADSKTNARLFSLFEESTRHEGPHTKFKVPGFKKAIWNASAVFSMQDQFDVIHDHSWLTALFMPFLNTPVVNTIHDPYKAEEHGYYTDTKERKKFSEERFAKMNYVTVSKRQEEVYAQQGKEFFIKHQAIHNGIPIERFPFNERAEDYLLYLGYINPEKGADVAVQIARHSGMRLILAGGNFGVEDFFAEKIQPYLNDQIVYVGPVGFEEKVKLYQNAKATLAPLSWEEPFGLTIIESQACGTPVIAFRKGAAPELISHGKTGFVVDTQEEMVEAVQKIDTIARINARKWVEENFTVSHMVDQYEKLYARLAARS